jgi:hypothetical protein
MLPSSLMCSGVVLMRTDVAEEIIISVCRVESASYKPSCSRWASNDFLP